MTEEKTPREQERDQNAGDATASVRLVARFDLKLAPDTSGLLAEKAVAMAVKYLRNAGSRDGTHIDPESVGVVAEKVVGAVPTQPRAMAKDQAWEPEPADLNRPLSVVGMGGGK